MSVRARLIAVVTGNPFCWAQVSSGQSSHHQCLQCQHAGQQPPPLAVAEEAAVERRAVLGARIEHIIEELEQDKSGECQRQRGGGACGWAQ